MTHRNYGGVKMQSTFFDDLKTKWPSAIVARTEVGRFSGGILSPGYLANLDSIGEGPPRIRVGRKVGYPVSGLVEWMRRRTTVIEGA
jgi:hypothetical protein